MTAQGSTRRSRQLRSATFQDVLILFEGPQLVFLVSDHNLPMFAVAVEREGMTAPFFACQVKGNVARNYFDGRSDLRYAFLRSVARAYYFFDLAVAEGETVALVRANGDEALDEKYWPASGLFSRTHTSDFIYGAHALANSIVRQYFIDGRWASEDFSRFTGKVENLYGLFALMKGAAEAEGTAERQVLGEAIVEKAWEGGGSYVSFYHDVKQEVAVPLDVEKLQYASPGEIALRGDQAVLSAVDTVVDAFDNRGVELYGLYRYIHNAMRKAKLLGVKERKQFPSKAQENHVLAQALKLCEGLALPNPGTLHDACRRDAVVFVKIVLSIYRRVKDLYDFHAEGRVYTEPQSSHLEMGIGRDFKGQ